MNTIIIRRGFSDIIANIATMHTAFPYWLPAIRGCFYLSIRQYE